MTCLQSRPLTKWQHLAHETETTTKMLQDCRAARIVYQTTTGQNVSSRAAAVKLKNELCFLRFHIWLLIKFNFATFENHCIQFLPENSSFVGIGVEQKKIYQFILLGWYSQFNFDFGQTTHCYFCYLNQFWWPASEKTPTLVQIWSLWASRVASEGGTLMVQLWDRDICSLVTWKYNSEFQLTKLQTSQQTTVFVQLIQ